MDFLKCFWCDLRPTLYVVKCDCTVIIPQVDGLSWFEEYKPMMKGSFNCHKYAKDRLKHLQTTL